MQNINSYYLKVFTKYDPKTFFFKWNWSAFFFGPFWLSYRGMYLYTVLYYTLVFLLLGVDYYMNQDFSSKFFRPLYVVVGVLGNPLYGLFLMKRYAKLGNSLDKVNVEKLLETAPKTSWVASLGINLSFIALIVFSIFTILMDEIGRNHALHLQ